MAKTYIMWLCDNCEAGVEDGLLITKSWKADHKCPYCKKGKMNKTPIEI